MRNKFIAGMSFILLISSIILLRWHPTLFDFNIVHNLYGPNIFYQTFYTPLPLIVGYGSIALTLLLGPIFCGYICPFGTFQRILHHIGHKLDLHKNIPITVHRHLSYLKYALFLFILWLLSAGKIATYIHADPYHGFIRLFYGGITLTAGLYLIVVILLSLMIKRPFCNYLCPYGAGLNVLSFFRVFKIQRKESTCVNCKACDHRCPVKITISTTKQVNQPECLSCHDCISACPRKGTLKLGFGITRACIAIILMALIIYQWPMKSHPTHHHVKNLNKPSISIEKPLKTTSVVDIYYEDSIDFIPVERAIEKHKIIVKAKIEAEKKAEAERLALQEAARKQQYHDGIYKAKVNGFAPDMLVQVELKGDQIIAVNVIEHDETRSYFNYSAEKMYKKIIQNNGPDVSVVAGCTYTSRGIKNGVRACLNQAKK